MMTIGTLRAILKCRYTGVNTPTAMVSRARQFWQHVVPAVIKPIRVLWNQVIGLLFVGLALITVPSATRAIQEFDGDAESLFRVILTALFGLLMAFFGITSFLRARRISRT